MRILLTGILVLIFSAVVKAQTEIPSQPPPEASYDLGEDTLKVFDKVEVEAAFPGGNEAWKQYLMRNFRVDSVSNIVWKQLPNKDKRKKGILQFTAIVQFIVCKDGSLCEIKTINDVPAAFKSEAERLIAASKVWEPAIQNGRPVKAYRKQPITMQIEVE